MKCPLFSAAIRREYGSNPLYGCDCLKGECALYHDGLEGCGLFLIQEYLALIMAQLVELNRAKGVE